MAHEPEVHGSVAAAASEALSDRDADPATGRERRRYLLARAAAG